VVTHTEYEKPVQGSVTNLEPIVTTEIKPTIVKKEGLLREGEMREGEMREGVMREGFREGQNPETFEADVQEKKSLGTKIKELFTGPQERQVE